MGIKIFKLSIICFGWLFASCANSGSMPATLPTETSTPLALESTLQPTPTASVTPLAPTPVPTHTETPTTIPPTETAVSATHTSPEPTPAKPGSGLLPPTGKIFMFWDDTPPTREADISTPSLFQIVSSDNWDDWQIEVVLEDMILEGEPITASPDQTKLALLLLYDTDGNGKIEHTGPYTYDIRNLYVYDVNVDSLIQVTDAERSIFNVSWLSNNTILYIQGEDIWSTNIDKSSLDKILTLPERHLDQVTLSPDDQLLITFAYKTEGYSEIFATYLQMDQTVPIPNDEQVGGMKSPRWSPDGQWLAFGQYGRRYFRHLSLLQTDTLAFTNSLIPYEDSASIPDWSLDSQWLAFTKNQNTLSLWHSETLTVTDIFSGTYMSPPMWASDKNQVAVGVVQGEEGKVLTYDPDAEAVTEWLYVPQVQTIEVFGWSPDNKWLIYYLADESSSGLYLVHETGETYQIMDTTGGDVPARLIWLP
jgi:Tol biopolymer transport system component